MSASPSPIGPAPLPSSELVRRACVAQGVPRETLVSRRIRGEKKRICRWRWAIMWVMREQNPKITLVALGKPVGIEDHSSVHYALKRSRDLIDREDPDFAKMVSVLKTSPDGHVPAQIFWRPPQSKMVDEDETDDAEGNGPVVGMRPFKDRSDPMVPRDEVLRRAIQSERSRAEYEASCLAAERKRYGLTRQTRAIPLSRQAL